MKTFTIICALLPALIVLYTWFIYLGARKTKDQVPYAEKGVTPTWVKACTVVGLWAGFFIGTYSAVEIIKWSSSFSTGAGILTLLATWLGALFVGIASIYCTMKVTGIAVGGKDGSSDSSSESSNSSGPASIHSS